MCVGVVGGVCELWWAPVARSGLLVAGRTTRTRGTCSRQVLPAIRGTAIWGTLLMTEAAIRDCRYPSLTFSDSTDYQTTRMGRTALILHIVATWSSGIPLCRENVSLVSALPDRRGTTTPEWRTRPPSSSSEVLQTRGKSWTRGSPADSSEVLQTRRT